jgi:acetyl-CoA C-acetyltransferase
MGMVLQAGAGQAPARQVAIACELPDTTPCTTINKVCGSSLKAVMYAASAVRAGELQVILCGGMESMTNAPAFIRPGEEAQLSTLTDDGLSDPWTGQSMGQAGDWVAREHSISREAMGALRQSGPIVAKANTGSTAVCQ